MKVLMPLHASGSNGHHAKGCGEDCDAHCERKFQLGRDVRSRNFIAFVCVSCTLFEVVDHFQF